MGVSCRTDRAGRKQRWGRSVEDAGLAGRKWELVSLNPASGLWVEDPAKAGPLLSPSGPGHYLLSDQGLCRWPAQSSSLTPGSPPSQRRGRFLERKWWHMCEENTREIHKNMKSHPVKELTLEKFFQRCGFEKSY